MPIELNKPCVMYIDDYGAKFEFETVWDAYQFVKWNLPSAMDYKIFQNGEEIKEEDN